MKKRLLSMLIILTVVLSIFTPVSHAADYPISLDDLADGARSFYSSLDVDVRVEIDTSSYPANLRIIHIANDGEEAEFSIIKLKNSAYDEGLATGVSDYDNLELIFFYPDSESRELSESVCAELWVCDCEAVLTGIQRGDRSATDAELKKAMGNVREALKTEVESGFKAGQFEAGNMKYAIMVSRTEEDGRFLRFQAGNKNVSFGVYATQEKIRKLAEGLSGGSRNDTQSSASSSSSEKVYNDVLSGRNEGSYSGASSFVLDNVLTSCTQLDVSIKMAEYTGNPFRTWIVYGCDRNGKWKKLDSFILDKKYEFEYQTFTLEFEPTDITALATNIDGGAGSKSFYVQYSNAVTK